MAGRAWRAAAVGAALLGAAAACRQLVGIGDAPPMDLTEAGAPRMEAGVDAEAGAVCGIAYSGASCEACLERSCCAEATACAGGTACTSLEQCVATCKGEPACRARCVSAHRIGPDPLETRLAACLATSCGPPCNIPCGGLTAAGAGADAAVACQACIVEKACTADQACAREAECQATTWCDLSATPLDQRQACRSAHDAGAGAWDMANTATAACVDECATGYQWYCVGHAAPPRQLLQHTQVTMAFFDTLAASRPTVDASVAVCPLADSTCMPVLSSGTTGADGGVTLDVPPDFDGYGTTGYLSVRGAGLIPELLYWDFHLSEPSFSYASGTFTQDEWSLVAGGLGIPIDLTTHAAAFIVATDCANTFAPGVQFTVKSPEADTRVFYLRGAGISTTADRTDRTGTALIVNVPVGSIEITATPVVLNGRAASVVTGWANPGTLTGFLASVTQ